MSGKALRLGVVFRRRREPGRSGLPTFSVTLNNGMVVRESLDRKTDSALAPEDHLLVRKDDVAYNMMRMWQGASGLAPSDGMVSPAYIVVEPNEAVVEPAFASMFLKSPRMLYLFRAYSYGLTDDRLRLYYKDFSRISVVLPPLERQRAIARAVSACRALARQVEGLLQEIVALKTVIVDRCFKSALGHGKESALEFGDLVDLVTERVEAVDLPLIETCIELDNLISDEGSLRGSSNGKSQLSSKTLFKKNDVLFGKLRPYLRKFWLADRGGACSSEIWVLRSGATLCPKYLFQLVQTSHFCRVANITCGSKMPRAEWDLVSAIPIHTSDTAEQLQVARRLEVFGEYIARLRRYLEHLNALHQALLSQVVDASIRAGGGV